MRKNLFFGRALQVFGALLLVTGLCAGNAFAATDAEPCAASLETRQLGYWLGNWATGSGADRATSKVFFSLDKCVFVEHWENAKGHVTEKTFAYSPEEKNWYGMFIDNQGRAHVFLDGKVSSERAEFHGPSRGSKGETVLNRLQVIHVPPDGMQEVWEKSTDNGITWTTAYRVQYSRTN